MTMQILPDLPMPTIGSELRFGVYIHVPFCVSKCSYCAFSVVQSSGGLLPAYLEAIHREIDAHARRGTWARRRADTLYFGGGTPSLASPTAIASLIAHSRCAFALTPDAEITLEVNPETASYDRLRGFLEAGVTRLSIGVQSLDRRELTVLSRAHPPERALRAVEQAQRTGCTNVNVDLIYGIPGQSRVTWAATVEAILAMAPDHLSAYALTPEIGTPYGDSVDEGRTDAPAGEILTEFEAVLHTALQNAGLVRYEISNYAGPGRRCRHNLRYWSSGDWLGIGASAHSHLEGWRWWNHFETVDYLQYGREGAWIDGQEELEPGTRLAEALAVGVRMVDGIDGEALRASVGIDPWERHRATLEHLITLGLIAPTKPAIQPTQRGLSFADTVAESFFSAPSE
jgi:oxygen-independent coproporphyrinogen-3 oxidase